MRLRVVGSALSIVALLGAMACNQAPAASQEAPEAEAAASEPAGDLVARGEYLVTVMGCDDCHTPKMMSEQGPVPDMSRRLSGHPADDEPGPPPALPGGWMAATNFHLTAWSGPWGISYAFNLTPEEITGLGIWTEEMFISALRTGRHMGTSRPILPPMPWQNFGQATDDDLKAIYAFLRALPPITNEVPQPVPPAMP